MAPFSIKIWGSVEKVLHRQKVHALFSQWLPIIFQGCWSQKNSCPFPESVSARNTSVSGPRRLANGLSLNSIGRVHDAGVVDLEKLCRLGNT